jgi:superfamily I DNA and/or RNA helicase
LSFVSTNPSYIENNYSFILEPARLNVAITRTRKKFIAIMHENMKQLLVSTDLEYLYILLMLFERYKRTFGIEESFEQFLEKYKSWNPRPVELM